MLFMRFFACQIFERAFLHNPSQVNAHIQSAVYHNLIDNWMRPHLNLNERIDYCPFCDRDSHMHEPHSSPKIHSTCIPN